MISIRKVLEGGPDDRFSDLRPSDMNINFDLTGLAPPSNPEPRLLYQISNSHPHGEGPDPPAPLQGLHLVSGGMGEHV